MSMKIVKVEWLDSRMYMGVWQEKKCAKTLSLSQCSSVGYLLSKDKEKVLIVTSCGDGNVQGTLAIPRKAIKSFEVVR